METITENEVEVQPVTFYSWAGCHDPVTGAKAHPSSTTVNISGGQTRVANDGSKVRIENKVAPFNKGRFTTADPEIIKALDRLCSRAGSGFTRDINVFYDATLTDKERAKREHNLHDLSITENDQLKKENTRLRKMLESKAQTTPPRRSKAPVSQVEEPIDIT